MWPCASPRREVFGTADDPVASAGDMVVMAAGMSAHDRASQGHAERVAVITDLVAEQLELPEPERDRLRWAALLHDVGKLVVHRDYLNKPGRLSVAEQELVHRHSLEGAKLAEPLSDWLGEWVLAIPEHHERYDGRGYPCGLEADEISIGGRMIAVADAYDVMTSPRSYKKPATPDAARAEIARLSGSQFDPVVVRAFLAVPKKKLPGFQPLARLGSALIPTGGSRSADLGRLAVAVLVALSIVGLSSWRPWSAQNGGAALAPATGAANGSGSQGAGASQASGSRAAGLEGCERPEDAERFETCDDGPGRERWGPSCGWAPRAEWIVWAGG